MWNYRKAFGLSHLSEKRAILFIQLNPKLVWSKIPYNVTAASNIWEIFSYQRVKYRFMMQVDTKSIEEVYWTIKLYRKTLYPPSCSIFQVWEICPVQIYEYTHAHKGIYTHTSIREICPVGILAGQLQNLTFYESTLVSVRLRWRAMEKVILEQCPGIIRVNESQKNPDQWKSHKIQINENHKNQDQ